MLKIYTLLTIIIVTLIACTPSKKSPSLPVEPQCLKNQSKCAVETQFGKVNILFDKDKVLTEDPFNIYLMLEETNSVKERVVKNKKPKVKYKIFKINSYMEGKEMFMGKIPIVFSPSRQKNVMVAKTLLGSCSEEKMVWRLWLTVFFDIDNENITNNKQKDVYQETFFIDFISSRS
jgi:hypothetical protein